MEDDTVKKPRVARACEPCRKRKIRCDGERPSCSNCRGSGKECVYTETVYKRKAKVAKDPNSTSRSHAGSSKSRLDRIEALLEKLFVQIGDNRIGEAADVILRHSSVSSVNGTHSVIPAGPEFAPQSASEESESDNDSDSEKSEDEHNATCKTESTNFIYPFTSPTQAHHGDTFLHTMERCHDRAFGGSSVFAVFSPSGLQWLSDQAGSPGIKTHMLGVFTKVFSTMHLKLRLFVEPIPEPRQVNLTREHVDGITSTFFEGLNYILGLLERDDWNQIVGSYFGDPAARPNGYAELYLFWTVMLIMSDLLSCIMDNAIVVSEEENLKIRQLALENSLFYYSRIMSLGGSMHALQGTIILALYFSGTPIPHGLHLAVNVGARLAIDLGLHRREAYTHLPPKVARLRMRNWWMIYLLDRDLSLRSGVPPVIHDNHVSTPSPACFDVDEDEGLDFVKWGDENKTSYAQLLHGLSKISSRIYNQLYSASAARKSPEKLSETILRLDRELMEWRERLPDHIRPGTDVMLFDCSKGGLDAIKPDNTLRSQIVVLHAQYNALWIHFNYYYMQAAIHRTAVYHPTWYNHKILGKGNVGGNDKSGGTPGGAGTPMSASSHEDVGGTNGNNNNKNSPNPRLLSSHSICVQASRNTIYLTRSMPAKIMSCFWSFSFFLLSAFIILLIHVLQRPLEATIRADLELMKIAIDFLKSLPDSHEFNFLLVFTEFYDVAVKFVDAAQERHRRQEAGEDLDPHSSVENLVYSTPTSMSSGQSQQPQQQPHPSQTMQQQHVQQQVPPHFAQQTPDTQATYNMMVSDFYSQTNSQGQTYPVDYTQTPQPQQQEIPNPFSRPGNEWYFDMFQGGYMNYGNFVYEE